MALPTACQQGATHVWIIIAHGLAAHGSSRNGFADLPNLRSIQRLGLHISRLQLADSDPQHNLRSLLFGEELGAGSLSQEAASAGRVVVQVLPWRHDRWIADQTPVPHWSIVEDRLGSTTTGWDDLVEGKQEFVSKGPIAAEVADYFNHRVLGRFPGDATRMAGEDALTAWMRWAADAFMRSVWYASARSTTGVFGLLTYPAPALLAGHYGPPGYDRGLELFDDLLGRLMMLRENPEMSDSVLVVCGAHAHPDSGAAPDEVSIVPLVAVGPQIEEGTKIKEAQWQDAAIFLRRLAGTPVAS